MAEGSTSKAASQSPHKKQEKQVIAELKNGKVTLKQKPMLLEKLSETLQEIIKFREMIEQRIEKQESPFQSFPDEFLPLIAKLGHESDKPLTALAKHIQQELIPPQEDEEEAISVKSNLPLQTIEQAIKTVLLRNNYGIESLNGSRPPASVCVWRWEVQQNHKDWLPKSAQAKLESRLVERVQAKESLRQVFDTLPQVERDAILDPKGTNRAAFKDTPGKELPLANKSENEKSQLSAGSTTNQDDKNSISHGTDTDGPGGPKKLRDPKKVAKEKKVAKVEKGQKPKDAQNKSRTLMANFFTTKSKSPAKPTRDGEPTAGPSRPQSDFERTFKPFVLKKGSILAPTNWFKDTKNRKAKDVTTIDDSGTIIIDSDNEVEGSSANVVMKDSRTSSVDISSMSARERLQSIMASLHPPPDRSRLPRSRRKGPDSQLRTYTPHSIRDFMSRVSEAEIVGDDNEVRTLLNQLQDRDLFLAKVFIYHEDARPGYFGTWTRSSKLIGPRQPFAKDVVEFDYGYDSGEEWEEEPMDDADDVLQDDDEDGGSDEADSDMDAWLVDDDEEPGGLTDDGLDLSPLMLPEIPDMPPPPPPPKRKAPEVDKKAKKRKVVIPLVPFSKGPCWETKIGECEYEPFNQYRIQLFNDTHFPIDPFAFVSTCVEDYKASLKTSISVSGASVPISKGPLATSNLPNQPNALSSILPLTLSGATLLTKRPSTLKNPFPDAHLPFLLEKISELQMSSFVILVETIYQELKGHKVKKVAIEAKIREVGEKCKEKKVWIVKPALKANFMQS